MEDGCAIDPIAVESNEMARVIEELAKGTDGAMEHCLEKFGALVWSVALSFVPDRTLVEEIVQDTFVDLWRTAGRYDPKIASENTYVTMLARRRAIDFVRRQQRQPIFERVQEPEYVAVEGGGADSGGADLESALLRLPVETQEIFSMHFEAGLTHPEIAKRTGLPLGTVKTRLRRGLIALRKIMLAPGSEGVQVAK